MTQRDQQIGGYFVLHHLGRMVEVELDYRAVVRLVTALRQPAAEERLKGR